MSYVIRSAAKNDVDAIVNLLKKGKLNVEGVDENIENFLVVAEAESKEIAGTAGFEILAGRYGLLRSLVLGESCPPQLVMDLMKLLLFQASRKDLEEIYLLTRTSQPFFQFFGFEQVQQDKVPDDVRKSTHFQQYDLHLSTVFAVKPSIHLGKSQKTPIQ